MSSQPNEPPERQSVPAINKAMRILDEIASAPSGLGVSEVARRTGLSKSTVHALVGAMATEGLLMTGDKRKTYSPGGRLLELASRSGYGSLLEIAPPVLASLASETGETALMGSLSGDHVTVLAAHQGTRSFSIAAPPGSSVPFMAGALGKAYLSSLPSQDRIGFLDHHPLPRYTERSILDVDAYLAEIDSAARDGYALDRGEYLSGVIAAASTFSWMAGTYFLWTVGIEDGRDVELSAMGNACHRAAISLHRQLDGITHQREESTQ